MAGTSSAPWKGFDEQSEEEVLRELTSRFNAAMDAARALAEAVGDHEYAARGREREAVLELAEWQVEGLARMAGRGGVDVGARWGKPPEARPPWDDEGVFELPYEVKRQGILGRMLKEWQPETS
jgi:hypothetical protein